MRPSRRRTALLTGTVLAALLGGCFEPPVAERLLLEFLSDGAARATLRIDLGRAEDFDSPAVRKRIAATERELVAGTDPWLTRFEGLTQGTDGTSFQRARGALREFRRWAELQDPAAFSDLFADDPVAFAYSVNGDVATLEIDPNGGSRATRKERERAQRDVEAWSAAFARYLDDVFALEAFLADHPEKREACWQRVFEVKLSEGDRVGPETSELEPAEEELAAAVGASAGTLLGAFEVDGSEAFSLDERVRKAFHPLSAQLLVSLPAPAVEIEGFDAPSAEEQSVEEEFTYAFPEHNLLTALDALESRWLVQGPARAMLDHLRSNPDSKMDIERFVTGPVTKEASPSHGPADVADPLLELLKPDGNYRLVWRIPNPEGE